MHLGAGEHFAIGLMDRPDSDGVMRTMRIDSDAAMKQSTWRYFQRENELPLR